MSDLGDVLALWRRVKPSGEPFVLATIVAVEGSSYRRPGARMVVTSQGERAGTISGGCLEAEVAKKAAWLVRHGPVVEPFKTSFDLDDEVPSGSGCGGTVHILLEPRESAAELLEELDSAWKRRSGLGVATVISGPDTGRRGIQTEDGLSEGLADLQDLAEGALRSRESSLYSTETCEIFLEYVPPRRGIFLFGAGDDAIPMVTFAGALGWYAVVIDGRLNLARPERFPEASKVLALADAEAGGIKIMEQDAVVLMTHSYEQDLRALRMALATRPAYVGMLGPRIRSERLVRQAAKELKLDYESTMSEIHAPLGMEIGRDQAAVIALAAVAEIQEVFCQERALAARSGLLL